MTASRVPGRVYAIADAEALGATPLPAAVAAMAGAGVSWIQVRAKRSAGIELYRALEACCRAVEGSDAALWVDDRADLAALFLMPGPVAGVHVGQTDLPPAAVRRVVGDGLRIGQSTHDEAQLAAADEDADVDVIAVGPVFPTASKERPDPVVGLSFVRRARARTAKPLVAIGGIDAGNAAAVLAAGADAVVVLGAVCRGGARGIGESCRRLLAAAGGA
ncbi:MAG TPA: thiamine phosphate synthase [Thermoanaerobaculia bacterium]|jgi:thiamine-phosphate pyrophosphorylase|nr:thiamine phosphate synthase [Thermoanaerobaculia bacterium]